MFTTFWIQQPNISFVLYAGVIQYIYMEFEEMDTLC